MNSDLTLAFAAPDEDGIPPDEDGIIRVSVSGVPIGEILKGTPDTWNIAQHRAGTITFYEAVDTDGELPRPAVHHSPCRCHRAGEPRRHPGRRASTLTPPDGDGYIAAPAPAPSLRRATSPQQQRRSEPSRPS